MEAVKKARLELRVETRAVVLRMQKGFNQWDLATMRCGRGEIRKRWADAST